METEPRFKNASQAKTFLGHFDGHDLYFDPQVGIPTVIARFGNEGPDYKSGLELGKQDLDPHLGEAYRLAKGRGLLGEGELVFTENLALAMMSIVNQDLHDIFVWRQIFDLVYGWKVGKLVDHDAKRFDLPSYRPPEFLDDLLDVLKEKRPKGDAFDFDFEDEDDIPPGFGFEEDDT